MSQHNPKPAEAVSNFEKLTGSYTQIESRLAAGELTRASAYEQASLMANSLQSMLSQTAAYFTSLIDQAQIQVIGAASSTVNQLFNFVSQLEATFGSTFYNPSQSFQTHASSQLSLPEAAQTLHESKAIGPSSSQGKRTV
ncbi:hypothetical protein PtB15_11B217 [Puccinia triticina]|nr:hypothetical protein PtB15_11B217 [Puccinia triticina]